MFIKVTTFFFFEVANVEQGEEVCTKLNLGLDSVIRERTWPGPGEFIETDVDTFREMPAEEVAERGFEEG